MDRLRSEQGFTLVELLAASALMAVVAISVAHTQLDFTRLLSGRRASLAATDQLQRAMEPILRDIGLAGNRITGTAGPAAIQLAPPVGGCSPSASIQIEAARVTWSLEAGSLVRTVGGKTSPSFGRFDSLCFAWDPGAATLLVTLKTTDSGGTVRSLAAGATPRWRP